MKITRFENQFATDPLTIDCENWTTLVQFFMEADFPAVEKKSNFYHFSLSTWDGYKEDARGLEMYGLVLDYDDSMTVDEAIEKFSQYEFIFYTSYNHQRVKNEGVAPCDKFRIVIPFVVPCPIDEWKLRSDYVEKLAPGVDKASKKFTQSYCMPCTHPDNVDNMMMFHNEGMLLDWRLFPKTDPSLVPDAGQADIRYRSENKLHPDDVIRLKKGTIRVADIDRRYQCYCPFHADKSPGAFVSRSKKDNVFLHCNRCGTAFMEKEKEEEDGESYIETFLKERKTKNTKPQKHVPLLTFDEDPLDASDDVVLPKSRRQRGELLKKRCLVPRKRMLLYAFEGFGKSYLTTLWAQVGQKVVFGCDSNLQAVEQAESFTKAGCKVQCITSREYKIETQYHVKPIHYDPTNPWDQGQINKKATIQRIADHHKMTEKEAAVIWDTLEADEPNFADHDVIVTTHSRVQVWGKLQALRYGKEQARAKRENDVPQLVDPIIPDNVIIVFDDPDKADFMRLKDFDNKFANCKINGKPIERKTIDNSEYFVKPDSLLLGYGLESNKIVFTTTELITSFLVERQHPDIYKPKLMPDGKLEAGTISLFKTELVRKKTDGILPVIIERLKKEEFNIEYFADGQGNTYNLTNNKGQNIFIENDTVIEISKPHESDVIITQHELGWTVNERQTVRVAIVLDKVHQAIGRNSGYRWSDNQSSAKPRCVVLCEPKLFNALKKFMRYAVEDCRDLDQYSAGYRKKMGNDLPERVRWLVQNYHQYIVRGTVSDRKGQDFMADVKAALNDSPAWLRTRRKKRLLEALIHIHSKTARMEDQVVIQRIIDEIAAL